MYLKQKLGGFALYFFGFLALAVAAALIGWFVSMLHLRTEYRAFCLMVNDVILATPAEERSISRGDECYPLSAAALDYYDQMLLDEGATVADRKENQPTAKSIILQLGDSRLIYTGAEMGRTVLLRWESPGETRCYTVRSDLITFSQLNAYFTNYARAQKDAQG